MKLALEYLLIIALPVCLGMLLGLILPAREDTWCEDHQHDIKGHTWAC